MLILKHAKEHLLTPDAIIIPNSACIRLQLQQWPWFFTPNDTQVEGFDIAPFNNAYVISSEYFSPRLHLHSSDRCHFLLILLQISESVHRIRGSTGVAGSHQAVEVVLLFLGVSCSSVTLPSNWFDGFCFNFQALVPEGIVDGINNITLQAIDDVRCFVCSSSNSSSSNDCKRYETTGLHAYCICDCLSTIRVRYTAWLCTGRCGPTRSGNTGSPQVPRLQRTGAR